MEWNRQTVLVTGAGGFIGSHLVEELVTRGARTRALVRYNSAGSRGWLDTSRIKDDIEVFAADVRDCESLEKAFRGVDIVFHLAALVGIPYSYHAPRSYVHTNIEGTLNVLQTALKAGCQRVVHTSTSEVYGTGKEVSISEDHPLKAQSPYSASKIAADKLAEAFYLSFKLPVAIIRPFNTFGPRQSRRAVIPTIVTQVLSDSVLRLGSLDPTRDFTYISDTVEGFIRIAERPCAVGEVINVGSGRDISVGSLAAIIMRLAKRSLSIVRENHRVRPDDSEVERLCADVRKARELLGWEPRHALEEGLSRTIEWIRTNRSYSRAGVYTV